MRFSSFLTIEAGESVGEDVPKLSYCASTVRQREHERTARTYSFKLIVKDLNVGADSFEGQDEV